MKSLTTDILVVGSGIAGLNFALEASEYSEVTVVTKSSFLDTNTYHAQGGIAAVLSLEDSISSYTNDIMEAGDGLSRYYPVKFIAKKSSEIVERLSKLGVNFNSANDKNPKGYDLGREGAHSHRRIAHVGTHTGKTIEEALVDKARKKDNIKFKEYYYIIDILLHPEDKNKVIGCIAYHNEKLIYYFSKIVVLASGGLGSLYKYTVNPDIATGDGIAMGYRAGCEIRDLEFIQFHPTALKKGNRPYFLISEAVRGEGAKLTTETGKRIMENYPRGELESRDIVAREIFSYMEDDELIFLDITHKSKNWLKNRFSNIYKKCMEYNIDMSKDKIPVAPAAHYSCGGIKVDLDGFTGIEGLFAIGELASTGVHGANRLASNSLLEAMVTSREASKSVKNHFKINDIIDCYPMKEMQIYELTPKRMEKIKEISEDIKNLMWECVGIIRNMQGLKNGLKKIKNYKKSINFKNEKEFTLEIFKIKNKLLVSELIIRSAISRKESRGCHYLKDYPGKSNPPEHTVLKNKIS